MRRGEIILVKMTTEPDALLNLKTMSGRESHNFEHPCHVDVEALGVWPA